MSDTYKLHRALKQYRLPLTDLQDYKETTHIISMELHDGQNKFTTDPMLISTGMLKGVVADFKAALIHCKKDFYGREN